MGTVPDRKKAVIGLSGGVDSTAAALLLKEKGMEVTGLYFDVTAGSREGRAAAEKAAAELEIDFVYKNVMEEFNRIVVENFCSEYLSGRTPNPCIKCNPAVKFKTLAEEADRQGAYYIATGHYARAEDGYIKIAASIEKDQSYMLYRLPAEITRRLLLPLGDAENKKQVRETVRENGLSNSDKKDSQEICFIDDEDGYIDFFRKNGYAAEKGDFIDKNDEIIGQHEGLANYTIGQRKGLGRAFGKKVFVTSIDPLRNTVTLGDNEDLLKDTVFSDGNFFIDTGNGKMPGILEGARVKAKIRYASRPADAVIRSMADGRVMTVFDEKQRAVTPGQSVVFYDGDTVAGGGFILST